MFLVLMQEIVNNSLELFEEVFSQIKIRAEFLLLHKSIYQTVWQRDEKSGVLFQWMLSKRTVHHW